MKAWLSLGCALALLFVASLSDAADPSPMEEKEAELKEEMIKKMADLRAESSPEEIHAYLEELENIMDKELPKDPQLRQNILKNIYQNIVQGQRDPFEGRGGGLDPFAPFQEVPFPR
ncbi:uncharacterized protein [Littorina saxatilis]|uniref:Uncharacterized protein n=1 Tax=Littorina saxatilis TaxID=31220 RepID=A0AAN9FVS1_9CAEN